MHPSRCSALLVVVACGSRAPVLDGTPTAPACAAGPQTLSAREDVARLAGCTSAGTLVIRPAGPLDLAPLAQLEMIESLRVGTSAGFEELSLPRLREVRGTLRIAANVNLRGVTLPALERAGRIEIEGNVVLGILALPKLRTTAALIVTDNPDLGMIDISSLAALPELVLSQNPGLALIELGPLAIESARVEGNAALPAETRERLRAAP